MIKRLYFETDLIGGPRDAVDLWMIRYFHVRLLFELRHLEDEINASDGVIEITYRPDFAIETRRFDDDLKNRIWEIIHSIDWKNLPKQKDGPTTSRLKP
jgi:hypothetical protein